MTILKRMAKGRFVLSVLFMSFVAAAWGVQPAEAQQAINIYRRSVHGIVWIVNKVGLFSERHGSGFLIDKERQLVMTCHHLIEGKWFADVYFPSTDADGDLICDPDFYKGNRTLREQGYATVGRVVAFDAQKDLAILHVNKVPRSAVELKTAFRDPDQNESLHVIGHPGDRMLWSYCPGIEPQALNFRRKVDGQQRDFRALVYCSGVFRGNSGGPVLNQRGQVVGLNSCAGGQGGMIAIAVHWREIDDLLDSVQPHYVFGIDNPTWSQLYYQIRWGDGKWEQIVIKGKSKYVHWWRGSNPPRPQIRFDCSTENGFQEKIYDLDCYRSYLGRNVTPNFDRDAREYYFQWVSNQILDLYSRQ